MRAFFAGPAVIAAALLFCGCRKSEQPPPTPPPPAGPAEVSESEPNDYQHAQQLPDRSVVTGAFAPPRPRVADDDWYRVAPGAGKVLALRIELAPEHGAELEVLDRDRNRLLKLQTAGEPLLVPAIACAEACFVRASSAEAGAYKLTVLGSAPAVGEELEPNDRAVDATRLAPGKPLQGTYGWPEDEDWYRVEVRDAKPGQFLRVELSGVAGVRPEIEVRALSDAALLATLRAGWEGEGLYVRDLSLALGAAAPDAGVDAGAAADASTSTTSSSSTPTPNPNPTATQNPAPAISPNAAPAAPGYYLVLRSAPLPSSTRNKIVRGANPRVPYRLLAALEAGPEDLEQEPNDDPARATELSGTRTGYLSPPGDVDWYRVRAEQPMILHVEVTPLERADVELSVLAPGPKPGDKLTLLARANEGGVREGEILPNVRVPAGESFVKVEGAARELEGKWVRDAEDRDHPYRITARLSPDDGSTDREPNDDVESAQPIALPATVRGWIWPRRDVDLFRFHVAAGAPPITIRLSAVRGVDLMLRLEEMRGGKAETIGTADASRGEGEEKIVAVPLKEGDYLIEVSSPRGKDASATQQYTLTVQ